MTHDVSPTQVPRCFWCEDSLPECHVTTFRSNGSFIESCPGCAHLIGNEMMEMGIKARRAQVEF